MLIEAAPASRRKAQLTPLIDVIFLLVMFFMLATTFLNVASLPLTTGGSGASASASPDLLIRLGGDGVVEVNGREVAMASVASTIDAQVDDGARTALLMALPAARVQDVASALAILRESRLRSVTVAK